MSKEIGEEYLSSLTDLNVNSKPLINMLTILAEENIQHASVIVQAIEQHLAKVNPDVKLPVLYLVDSIVKNVGGEYKQLFSQCIVNMFCGVFEKVNEKIREKLFALRQTWADVFPNSKLCALDIKVQSLDPGWPIIAKVPTKSPSIHVNPNFLKKDTTAVPAAVNEDVQAQLREKQRKLLELQKRKLELELVATKKKLEEQEREMTNIVGQSTSTVIMPDGVVKQNAVSLASTTLAPSRTFINTAIPSNQPLSGPLTVTAGVGPKIRVAPVNNSAMLTVFRNRDPRLARQQQLQQQQQQQQQQLLSQQTSTIINNSSNFNNNSKMNNSILNSVSISINDTDNVNHGNHLNKSNLPKIPKYSKSSNGTSNSNNRQNISAHSNQRSSSVMLKKNSSSGSLKSPPKLAASSSSSSSSKSKGRSHSSGSLKSGGGNSNSSNKLKDRSSGDRDLKNSRDDKKKSRKRSPSPQQRSSSHHNDRSPKSSSESKRSESKSPARRTSSFSSKFKDIKIPKHRNYAERRNRSNSKSPTPTPPPPILGGATLSSPSQGGTGTGASKVVKQDVDLRLLASPNDKKPKLEILHEDELRTFPIKIPNQISIKINSMPDSLPSLSQMQDSAKQDVDLRQLPQALNLSPSRIGSAAVQQISPSSIISTTSGSMNIESSPDTKKRQSNIEMAEEPLSKRSKTEKIDELFGSEDVDLRTLGQVNIVDGQRPITPPPPMISSDSSESSCWAKLKGDAPNKKQPVTPTPKSNLDAVRAKFAEATKKGRSRLSKSPEPKVRKIKLLDIDLRKKQNDVVLSDETSQECNDANIKIMVAQAEEQFSSKNIDVEEYGSMIKQIFEINENKKIREAERREYMRRKTGMNGPWQQTDLTPVSEDEIGFSTDTSDDDVKILKTSDNRRERLRFRKKTNVASRLASSKNATNLLITNINNNVDVEQKSVIPVESYAQSTAAELRNISGERINSGSSSGGINKDPRWAKMESNNSATGSSKWISPWESATPTNPSAWNVHHAPVVPNAQVAVPGITPFANNSITNQAIPGMWQNVPFSQPAALPVVPAANLSGDLVNQNIIKDDVVRTINIDLIPREIRFYDDIAIAFMNWDEPKEIGFQLGKRRVTVDDTDTIILGFNEPNKIFIIDGKSYEIRLGSPTRELYIDNNWHECFFGDPPIGITLDGKVRIFKVDGPPPPVKIGNLRQDLVVGKINLIIDARTMVPIFLDSKLQYFEIDGQLNTLQFADYLLTVLINDEPFSVEFGGLPKSLYVRNKKHFVRFTALPQGIEPGKVFIRNMLRTSLHRDVVSPPAPAIVSLNDVPQADNAITSQNPIESSVGSNMRIGKTALSSSDSGALGPPILSASNTLSSLPGLDFLAKILPKTASTSSLNSSVNYDCYKGETVEAASSLGEKSHQQAQSNSSTNLLGNVNIDDLYQKLLASGILSKPASSDKPKEDKKSKEKVNPIDLTNPDTIKSRQSGIVFQLFSGMQCSSCGVRFPPEQTMKYSQHLDWHFRQNRRDRDSARRAHSRRWYYDVSDWIQYEEIEDLEEREKNWFETQQTEMDLGQDESNHKSDSPVPSCPSGSLDVDKTCNMCHDPFEQFYNEETEEWHLRSAIRVDEKTYHPLCYEDYKSSLTLDESQLNVTTDATGDNANDDEKMLAIKKEREDNDGSIKIIDDFDDDDVIEVTPQEPVVTEILDEDEDMPEVAKENDGDNEPKAVDGIDELPVTTGGSGDEGGEKLKANESLEAESDVEIQEPHIPVTDLDDFEDPPEGGIIDEDTTTSVGSPFVNVKIKEEPRDEDDAEDDGFEEVGTVVENLEESLGDEYIPEPVVDTAYVPPMATIDGNVEVQESVVPTSNKIKINITKSLKVVQSQSTSTLQTSNSTNTSTNIGDRDGDDGSLRNVGDDHQQQSAREEEIEFEYKEQLRDVTFKKMDKVKNGYETSGLCSIM